ncbi:DUF899 domain-containing protein [Streptomyces sp. UH6]|uniref:DUF899 domain-containing protein n=1 Tax=Streptomyces sp. UH6 TaxID=2748379 RepID=UPI0015D509AC|nr:DUF899 domain-containing protein [Streptomyces sp. UH6]NYV75866.1 DUF899 domain-containing protein [Streptomyces sp. UH6]
MTLPQIVSREEWRAAREALQAGEDELARARHALNARRRRLPMVEVDDGHVFDGGDGRATLLDLFEGRHQLIVHHFVFPPEWEAGCPESAAFLDQMGPPTHLWARNTTFAAVSRAPLTRILPFKARMGWSVPWYSSSGCSFTADLEATVVRDGRPVDRPGLSCFLRERDRVFHTYSTFEDGMDGVGSLTSLLDLTALGRQEEWEEPRGRADALGAAARPALRFHDEYDW